MAATRKLQGEIDRCLKKVTEGVETFEDIWQKVHNATNSNQKEKYEADLKKEIKKLQRLRDQIKSWIASAEIKDKSILMDNRKLIETQMERFKVVERETKTKAYSKEGLGAAQKLDPAQKEREETEHWLKTSIDKLCCGTDSFESEIELILSNKKKKLDKDKQDRIDELKSRLEKHRFHIRKLETLMRMLLNETVEVEQIKNLKDNVEYYIDSNSEPDFNDDDMVEIYDDIAGMEDMELSGAAAVPTADYNEAGGGTPTSVVSGSSPVSSPPPMAATTAAVTMAANLNNHSTDNLNEVEKKAVCRDHPKPVKPTPILAVTTSIPISIIPSSTTTTTTTTTTNTTNSTNSITAVSVATSHNCVTGSIKSNTTPSKQTTSTTVTTPVKETEPASPVQQQLAATSNNFAAVAASITRATAIGESNPASVITTVSQVQTQITSNTINSVVLTNPISSLVIQNSTSQPEILYDTDPHNHSSTCRSPDITNISEVSSVDIDASQPITNGPTPEKVSDGMTTLKSMAQQVIDQAGLQNSPVILESNKPQNQGKSDAHIPPLLGVAPLGAVPLQKEHQTQFQLMESAFYHMPQLSDSERIRTYLPRSPCSTPSYYSQTPLSHSDTLDFYQRLATETLFFVFYYMEGTKAQYLAARALKKQSWRFHTKYMMWFQRHEEPKIINEEYEQGTYIYFDYEKWGQRKKEGFTFEYKYLEDRDLN